MHTLREEEKERESSRSSKVSGENPLKWLGPDSSESDYLTKESATLNTRTSVHATLSHSSPVAYLCPQLLSKPDSTALVKYSTTK
jgi:hypothetical protein